MGPDAAGVEERLVAAGECVEDGVHRGPVDGRVVGGGQADDRVGPARRLGHSGRDRKIAPDGPDARGGELRGGGLASGQPAHVVARGPESVGDCAADVAAGAGEENLHIGNTLLGEESLLVRLRIHHGGTEGTDSHGEQLVVNSTPT